MGQLAGKIALVTGASSGIGAAIVRMLLEEGARVAAVARRADRLADLAPGRGDDLLAITADINATDAPQAIVEQVTAWGGGLDILINNAGLSRGNALADADPADLRVMVETNIWSLIDLTRVAVPWLKAREAADIINIGSIAARATMPGSTVYSATKAAVGAFSEALRRELADDGVRVTVIHPGYVSTEFFEQQSDPAKRARSAQTMAQIGSLEPGDLSDLARFVLTRAPGVNIGDVTIRPTKQPM